MASQEVEVSHGKDRRFIQFQQYEKLQVLKNYLRETFDLGRFKLYYKEKDAEVFIETEKEYVDMVKSGDVRKLFLVEENQKEKNNFDFFMSQLFVNNICCENDQHGCVICQEKKQVNPDEFNQLVKECLGELLSKDDFQAFCRKQFKMNIQDVSVFLEQFSKLSKPIKQILTIQPQQQQQYQQNYQIQQISAIRQHTPIQSSFLKQNNMNKSTNFQRQSEVQQKQSQLINQGASKIQSTIIQGYSVKYETKDKEYNFNADTFEKIEITIINNGSLIWPQDVYIKQVGHYPPNFQYIPALSPGERRDLKLSFQTPINSGSYTFTWVMFYKDNSNDQEKRIGSKCITEFKVKDLHPQQKINKCVEMIYSRIFQNKTKREIRSKVEDQVQKNQEMGVQQIINLVSELLEQ